MIDCGRADYSKQIDNYENTWCKEKNQFFSHFSRIIGEEEEQQAGGGGVRRICYCNIFLMRTYHKHINGFYGR